MPEELKLIEAVAKAGKLPFRVRVSKGGGEFVQGHELEIREVGVRAAGRKNAGEVTYAFRNLSTGRDHRDWRHDSDARFTLVANAPRGVLPQAVEALFSQDAEVDDAFGCYTDKVKELVTHIYTDLQPKANT